MFIIILFNCNPYVRTCLILLGFQVFKTLGCYMRVFTESLFFKCSMTNKISLNFGDFLPVTC